MSSAFSYVAFQTKVQNALGAIRTVLENHKNPLPAADASHTYDDKYLLVQLLTNCAIAAQCMQVVGCELTHSKLLGSLGFESKEVGHIGRFRERKVSYLAFEGGRNLYF